MQEVIVYRNPAEAAFWHLLMSGEFFVFGCAMAVFLVVVLTVNSVLSRFFGSYGRKGKRNTNISLWVGFIAFCLTIYFM